MQKQLLKYFLIILFFITQTVNVFSETTSDTLFAQFKGKSIENLPTEFSKVGANYLRGGKYKEGKIILDSALSLLTHPSFDDSTLLKGKILCNLGVANYRLGNNSKSISSQKNALTIYQGISNDSLIGQVLLNLGLAYKNIGANDKALEFLISSLKILEPLDKKKNLSAIHNALGNIYKQEEDFLLAEKHLILALNLRVQINYKKGIGQSFHNLGQLYFEKNKLDSAEKFFHKALKIKYSLKKSPASTLSQLGDIYIKKGNYDKANQYLRNALRLRQNSGILKSEATVWVLLGELALAKEQLDSAQLFFQNGLKIANKVGNWSIKENAVKGLIILEKKLTQLKEALRWNDSLLIIKENLYDDSRQNTISRLRIEFDVEQKEQAITSQNLELKVNNAQIERLWIIIAFTLLIAIAILFAGLKVRNEKKKTIEKNIELEKSRQKEEMLRKELKHRTSNNFETLLGILYVQIDNSNSDHEKEAIDSIITRINAMNIVHHQLQETNTNKFFVLLSNYLLELLDNLLIAYKLDRNKARIIHQFDSIEVSFDTALLIGLIVNELIRNSFKHGWVDNDSFYLELNVKGKINVEISMKNSVANNSEIINKGAGLTIIRMICDQFNGNAKYTQEDVYFLSRVNLKLDNEKKR